MFRPSQDSPKLVSNAVFNINIVPAKRDSSVSSGQPRQLESESEEESSEEGGDEEEMVDIRELRRADQRIILPFIYCFKHLSP